MLTSYKSRTYNIGVLTCVMLNNEALERILREKDPKLQQCILGSFLFATIQNEISNYLL